MLSEETRAQDEGYEGFQHAQTMAAFPPAAHDVFFFDELLTEEERDIRHRTRVYMVLFFQYCSL